MPAYDDYARHVLDAYGPEPGVRARPSIRWRRHIVLFLLTIGTMSLGHDWRFVAVLMTILFAHEMGHYVACRVYDVDASPPYFLPGIPAALVGEFFPGTFGAFIRIRERIPSRKALFDIGIAGPLAGFVVALLFLPAAVQEIEPIPLHLQANAGAEIANPLLFRFVVPAMRGFPDSTPYMAGPVFMAVWWGLFVTMLNLLPIGQLDGGHVAYAVFGRRYNRLAIPLLLGMWSFVYVTGGTLALMALLVTLTSPFHPPVQQERQRLGVVRTFLAVAALAVFVACFTPLKLSLPADSSPSAPASPSIPTPDNYA